MKWLVIALVLFASPAYAATLHVPAGGSLADAITAAKCGDTLTLEPGAVYQAPSGFVLPAKGCTEATPITIKTAGVTVTARNQCTAAGLAKVQSTGDGQQTFKTDDNADWWTLEGLEITATGTIGYGMVRIGEDIETVAANLPVGVKLLGNYIHKDREERRGVAYNAGAFTLQWNCIKNFRETGNDSQAVAGWNATGPCLIHDNYLQAASEVILFGGADPGITGLVTADCVITNNSIEKDPAWCGKGYNAKNLLELKSARRFRIENNDLRYSCVDAQDGYAVLLTASNQGSVGDGCTWCVVADIQFRHNRIRDVASCFSISGRNAYELYVSDVMTNVLIEDNLCVTNVAAMGPGGWCMTYTNSPLGYFIVRNNTFINEASCLQVDARRDNVKTPGVIWENNLARHGSYGVTSHQGVGTPTFEYFWAPGYVFNRNVLAGGIEAGYALNYYPAPASNTTMPSQQQFEGGFVSYAWPYTVKPDGIFAGMGATTDGTAPSAPPTLPPAPVDPCLSAPLVVKVTAWPKGQGRKTSGTWDPLGAILTRAVFVTSPMRFEATDDRGCTTTVFKGN